MTRFTRKTRYRIRKFHREGYTISEIAIMYDVDTPMIQLILRK